MTRKPEHHDLDDEFVTIPRLEEYHRPGPSWPVLPRPADSRD
jgi:hypothetical protein